MEVMSAKQIMKCSFSVSPSREMLLVVFFLN